MGKEFAAFGVAALLGAALLTAFAAAARHGTERDREMPFRAILGDARFEALQEGEFEGQHYFGDGLAAPDVSFTRRDGSTLRLADLRGKVVVLNFWSITCPPCIAEMAHLERLARFASPYDDVVILAVNADASWEQAELAIPPNTRLEHVIDPERAVVSGAFGTRLFPETWIVDREGVIRFRYDGARDWSEPVVLDLIRRYR